MKDPIFEAQKARLKGRLFGLLCEREKNGEWEKFLDTITIELRGMKTEADGPTYRSFMYKIYELRYLSYKYFRSTVLDCINAIGKVEKDQ